MGGAGLGALVGFPLKITIGRRFFLGSLNSTSRNTRHRTGLSVGEDHGVADKLSLGLLELAEDRGRTDFRSWHG
jgi:hypothetical protein